MGLAERGGRLSAPRWSMGGRKKERKRFGGRNREGGGQAGMRGWLLSVSPAGRNESSPIPATFLIWDSCHFNFSAQTFMHVFLLGVLSPQIDYKYMI